MDKKKEKYIRKKAEPDEVESDLISFDLVDAKTIKRRIEEGDVRTPFMRTKKYLDIPKDQRWNTKALNSKLMAGILNGDSIPKIATSLQDVIGNNSAAATRNARTIITGAENAGRKDSYEDLEEQGVIQKKVWIATPDDRTRESHLLMDGEEVDIDEPFSNGLMYPADPSGDASEVYNCRCTMRTHIIGFKKADGRIEKVGQRDDIGHEAAIAKEQAEREAELERKRQEKEWREAENEAKRKQEEERREEIDRQEEKKIAQGRDIAATFERRPDQFAFEIEDVINAQGFDGLPRVVSEKEFDEAVKKSNFIAQRTYSAPDQETLEAYRDQLYNGKWYVDCSTGGAQYGQGMYCAANYNGELDAGIKMEMTHYKNLGESRYETYFDAGEARQRKFKMAEQEGDAIIAKGGTNEEARKVYDSIMNMDDKEWAEKHAPELLPTKGVSYTETLTLAPDAKIITYDELLRFDPYEHSIKDTLSKMDISEEYKYIIEDKTIGVSDERFGSELEKRSLDLWKNMDEEEKENFKSIYAEVKSTAKEYERKFNNIEDAGSKATLLGYDAINAENHGKSGSYTVILNRTKVIIKEDEREKKKK